MKQRNELPTLHPDTSHHSDRLWIPAFAPLNPPAKNPLPLCCRIRLAPASRKQPREHTKHRCPGTNWFCGNGNRLSPGHHSFLSLSHTRSISRRRNLDWRGSTVATDQMTGRPSLEHVPALPSRCRQRNPAQTQAEEELASPSFNFSSCCIFHWGILLPQVLQVHEEHRLGRRCSDIWPWRMGDNWPCQGQGEKELLACEMGPSSFL